MSLQGPLASDCMLCVLALWIVCAMLQYTQWRCWGLAASVARRPSSVGSAGDPELYLTLALAQLMAASTGAPAELQLRSGFSESSSDLCHSQRKPSLPKEARCGERWLQRQHAEAELPLKQLDFAEENHQGALWVHHWSPALIQSVVFIYSLKGQDWWQRWQDSTFHTGSWRGNMKYVQLLWIYQVDSGDTRIEISKWGQKRR